MCFFYYKVNFVMYKLQIWIHEYHINQEEVKQMKIISTGIKSDQCSVLRSTMADSVASAGKKYEEKG